MGNEGTPRLRVLVSDGPGVRLDEVTRTIAALGHDVIARESSLPDVARITATERPDVAVVIVHEGTAKALQLIDRIVHEAACPVIAVLDVQDGAFINEAAQGGFSRTSRTDTTHRRCRARSTSSFIASPSTTPGGRVRTKSRDGAREGDLDGSPRYRRASGLRHAPERSAADPAQGDRAGGGRRG
jgi:hypothetical protein